MVATGWRRADGGPASGAELQWANGEIRPDGAAAGSCGGQPSAGRRDDGEKRQAGAMAGKRGRPAAERHSGQRRL